MEALSLIDVSAEDDLLYDLASPAPSRPDPPHVGEVFRPHFGRNRGIGAFCFDCDSWI